MGDVTRIPGGRAALAALAVVVLLPSGGQTQQPDTAGQGHGDLAAKLANPISDLVSVPLQFNWEQGVGPADRTRFILNVQPVMPFALSSDWNLIVRAITPFVGQPELVDGGEPTFGIGDLTTSFFFSPVGSSGFTWGIGPVFVLPSGSEPAIGTGRWSAGPTLVALQQTGAWTFGVLWNQAWSFAGDSDRSDVSQMFVQPFFAYQASKTLTLTLQSESTANWEAADGGDTWTVPINFVAAKLSTFGSFPASYQLGGGVFVAQPDVGPSWKIRAAIVILMPHTQE
jgi:hypothetical protein